MKEYHRRWYPQFNSPDEFEDPEKFNEATNQLIADLQRLLPDFFDPSEDTSLDLESKPIRDRIHSRWQRWAMRVRQE